MQVGDNLLLALKMTNCKPDAINPSFDSINKEIEYDVDVDRSRNSKDALRKGDVENRLLELGLCSACADNVAQYYTQKPDSQCGQLARSALEGDPDAKAALQQGPSFCEWNYPAH